MKALDKQQQAAAASTSKQQSAAQAAAAASAAARTRQKQQQMERKSNVLEKKQRYAHAKFLAVKTMPAFRQALKKQEQEEGRGEERSMCSVGHIAASPVSSNTARPNSKHHS